MSRLNLIEAQHGSHRLTEGGATSSENTNSSVATNSEIAGNSEITNSEVTNSEVTTSNENANINNFQFGHYQATNGRISPLPDGDRKNKITLKITRSPRAGSLDVAEDLSSKNVEPLKIKTRGWNGNSGNLENGVAKNANLENGDIKHGNHENGNHENGNHENRNSENENGRLETVETDDNMDEKEEIDENEEIDDESENSEKSDISEQYNGISAYKSNYSPRTSNRLKTKQKEPPSLPSEPNRRTSRRLQTVKTEVEVSETSESSVRRSSRRIQKRVHSTDEEDEDEDDDEEEDEEEDEEDEEEEDEDENEAENAEHAVDENIEENHSDDEINEIHAKSSRNHPKSYKNRKNNSFHQRISLTRSPLTRNTDSRTSEKIDEKPSRLSSAEKQLAISGPFIPSASTNETIPYEMETLQAALRSTIEGNDDRLDKHKIDTTYRALQDYSIALRHNCLRTTQKIRNLAALKETVVEKLEKNEITPIEVFKSIRESMEITETDGGVKIRKTDFDAKQNASKTTSEGLSDPASKPTSEISTIRQITFKKPIALKRNPLQYRVVFVKCRILG